jgi:hypothetical protein
MTAAIGQRFCVVNQTPVEYAEMKKTGGKSRRLSVRA